MRPLPSSEKLVYRLGRVTLGKNFRRILRTQNISSPSLSEEKSLRDDDILQNLPVGTTATMYFRDLGPQLGWTMVRRAHGSITDVHTVTVTQLEKKSVSVSAVVG